MDLSGALDEVEVCRRLHIGADTLRNLIARGDFPAGIAVSDRIRVWLEMDVAAYLHLRSRIPPSAVRRLEGEQDRTEGD